MRAFRNTTIIISSVVILLACSNINSGEFINSKVVFTSQCKSSEGNLFIGIKSKTTGNSSGILFNYNPEREELSLTHLNAAFNCCKKVIISQSLRVKDTIIIKEGEEGNACKCMCLVDVDISISGIKKGRYVLKIEEPYTGDQPRLIFPIDLNQSPYGSFFVQRDGYPWI